MLQDREGYLWFGTQDGLNRYDGHSFAVYRHDPEDPQSLRDDYISAIYEDRSGVLWIGTYGGGLDRLDENAPGEATFTHYRNDPEDPASLSNNLVVAIH